MTRYSVKNAVSLKVTVKHFSYSFPTNIRKNVFLFRIIIWCLYTFFKKMLVSRGIPLVFVRVAWSVLKEYFIWNGPSRSQETQITLILPSKHALSQRKRKWKRKKRKVLLCFTCRLFTSGWERGLSFSWRLKMMARGRSVCRTSSVGGRVMINVDYRDGLYNKCKLFS